MTSVPSCPVFHNTQLGSSGSAWVAECGKGREEDEDEEDL